MLTFLKVLFVIAAPLLVLAIYRTSRNVKKYLPRTATDAINTGLEEENPWRATSIIHGRHACDAVKDIANKRFLDIEKAIPALPLPNCDVTACNCKYAFYEDRRAQTEDQRHPATQQSDQYGKTGGTDQRREEERGRRQDD